jgi:lipopolysaccharide export LptBFGC system permease protein LptF
MPADKLKSLVLYMLLGIAVAFLVITLLQWISAEMSKPIPMALFIGIFMAFIFWVLYEHSRKEPK